MLSHQNQNYQNNDYISGLDVLLQDRNYEASAYAVIFAYKLVLVVCAMKRTVSCCFFKKE